MLRSQASAWLFDRVRPCGKRGETGELCFVFIVVTVLGRQAGKTDAVRNDMLRWSLFEMLQHNGDLSPPPEPGRVSHLGRGLGEDAVQCRRDVRANRLVSSTCMRMAW